MLLSLRIQNVALIHMLEISFGDRLNILTGETGAGKSIIIDSINFVLGERPGKDFIRNGESMAEVEAMLSIGDAGVAEALQGLGVALDEGNGLLLSRTLTDAGKSVCRVNGRVVTVGMLKELSALLIDIHGQHEHQSLLNPARHIELLDRFCGEELDALKAAAAEQFRAYREIAKQVKALSGGGTDRDAQLEVYNFQINEIEAARLRADEEDTLNARRKFLNESERLTAAANDVLTALYGRDDEVSALDLLADSLDAVETLAEIDGTQRAFADGVVELHARLEDLLHDFRRYCDRLESDPDELDEIETRLDVIYRLKRKYGATVAEVLAHCEQTKRKLSDLQNSDAELARLAAERAVHEKEIARLAMQMSALRKAAAQKIERQIEAVLRDLGMKSAAFAIGITRRDGLTPGGFDKVEFLIAPNAGEPMKGLSQIASGGEMSRVMLALKTALADCDQIETFIFDEIDVGVSGRTAQQVAEKLAVISRAHQILCVTHLPQIAAMGDVHFLIEKQADGGRTTTAVVQLTREQSVDELARLMSGAQITSVSRSAAEEMKALADAKKN